MIEALERQTDATRGCVLVGMDGCHAYQLLISGGPRVQLSTCPLLALLGDNVLKMAQTRHRAHSLTGCSLETLGGSSRQDYGIPVHAIYEGHRGDNPSFAPSCPHGRGIYLLMGEPRACGRARTDADALVSLVLCSASLSPLRLLAHLRQPAPHRLLRLGWGYSPAHERANERHEAAEA